ncbi:MAG TPA: methyltransferase [Pirellulales bacterium]|nr:methyltransferase [Pirellulales bacterium]
MPASPASQMARLISGYWISQAIYAAAKLGLADLLKNGPRTAEDLAHATQTHAPSLYRLLRALASVDVFAEDDQRRFSLTPLAETLRSDVPGSQWSMAIMMGEEHYRAYGELLYSVQSGETAFEKLYGAPIFDFLTKNQEQRIIFDAAMTGVHGRETGAVLDAFDFSNIRCLADIGGGNGSVIVSILRRYPELRGILFDLADVADRARDAIEAAGLAGRCQVVGGDFFQSAPVGADAYLMRHIIHDWDDEESVDILRSVHGAMRDDGRLLLVESVIMPGNDPFFGKLLDLTMLVIPGGRERSEVEFRGLLDAAGFTLVKITPTEAEVSVIEAVKQTSGRQA